MPFILLVLLGAVAIVLFRWLTRMSAAGNQTAHAFALLVSFALLIAAGIGGLVALVFLGLRCGENCDEGLVPSARAGHWWNTQDAWQWYAQFGFALVGAVAVGAALVFTARHRYDLARPSLLVGATCFFIWAFFVDGPFGNALGI
jgi:hypothetical protein